MTYTEYKNFSFRYFWSEMSPQEICEYSRLIGEIFRRYYAETDFSEQKFAAIFQLKPRNFNPNNPPIYQFVVKKDKCCETWRMKLRLTQISHLECGIVTSETENCESKNGIVSNLLKDEAASIIISETKSEITSKSFVQCLFPYNSIQSTISYSGYKTPLYLWFKLEDIKSLRYRSLWKLENGEIRFYTFANFVEKILDTNEKKQILNLHCDADESIAYFIKECDREIASQLSEQQIERLLDLIKLAPSDWFLK